MLKEEVKQRMKATEAFFNAAVKIATIADDLVAADDDSDPDVIRQRLADLALGDGNDRETGDPITGPT